MSAFGKRTSACALQMSAFDPKRASAADTSRIIRKMHFPHRGQLMRRREFIGLLGSAVATGPVGAYAQQGEAVRRIGILMSLAADDPEGKARFTAFQQSLELLGWIEGRNVRIETCWAGGKADNARKYAAELIGFTPDVILASGGAIVGPLLEVTRTVPIVFTQTPDPVAAGFVASLASPGGKCNGVYAGRIWDSREMVRSS